MQIYLSFWPSRILDCLYRRAERVTESDHQVFNLLTMDLSKPSWMSGERIEWSYFGCSKC